MAENRKEGADVSSVVVLKSCSLLLFYNSPILPTATLTLRNPKGNSQGHCYRPSTDDSMGCSAGHLISGRSLIGQLHSPPLRSDSVWGRVEAQPGHRASLRCYTLVGRTHIRPHRRHYLKGFWCRDRHVTENSLFTTLLIETGWRYLLWIPGALSDALTVRV